MGYQVSGIRYQEEKKLACINTHDISYLRIDTDT